MASRRRHFRAPPAIESCGHAFARAEPGELPMIHRVTGLGLLVLALSLVGCAQYYWSQPTRSEEHTSELQSRLHLVCRLLLEKKKKNTTTRMSRWQQASECTVK